MSDITSQFFNFFHSFLKNLWKFVRGLLGPSSYCFLSPVLKLEIASYQEIANQIIDEVVRGSFKGKTYDELSYMADKFGSREVGSESLEKAIDFMLEKMKKDGLENVGSEDVTVPHWVRGKESAEMIMPRKKKLAILGLGSSIGTPSKGVQADVIVVKTFDELKARANEVPGKIVVFNERYDGIAPLYRHNGASEAAKFGAVAALIRSITPLSIYTPHTGYQNYTENVTKIPVACITVEDAEMMDRMQKRGWNIVVNLKMGAKNLPPVTSRNAIGDIKGRELPKDFVILTGHMDSWDVGEGAADDGGGVMIAKEALAVLKYLNLRPRRTIRALLTTGEEVCYYGITSYLAKHAKEVDNIKTVLSSDTGTYRPLGLDFWGNNEAGCIVREILKLLKPIKATRFRKPNVVQLTALKSMINIGIPVISLNTENFKLLYFHHTDGDTMTVENSTELDLCTAVWAVSAYVLADLSIELPR